MPGDISDWRYSGHCYDYPKGMGYLKKKRNRSFPFA